MSNNKYITIHLYELLYILFVFGHCDDLSLLASILRGRLQSFVDVLARSFSSRSWHFHFLSWSTYKIRPTIVVIVSDTGNAIHV